MEKTYIVSKFAHTTRNTDLTNYNIFKPLCYLNMLKSTSLSKEVKDILKRPIIQHSTYRY